MAVGVTLVSVAPGQERSVFDALKGIPRVRELHHVFGEYDFLVVVETEGLSLLSKNGWQDTRSGRRNYHEYSRWRRIYRLLNPLSGSLYG